MKIKVERKTGKGKEENKGREKDKGMLGLGVKQHFHYPLATIHWPLATIRYTLVLCLLLLVTVNALAVSSVDTNVTSTYTIRYAHQRKTFYANGRWWLFYSDGTNIVYQTSTDASTWSGKSAGIRGCDRGNRPDAQSLTNGLTLPIVVAMTCLNGVFQDIYSESIAEALIRHPNGGAVAVWASSGLTEPDGQSIMHRQFITSLLGTSPTRLGDAIIPAKGAMVDPDIRKTWVLIGDPSMRITLP
jgi:hypothetical protein